MVPAQPYVHIADLSVVYRSGTGHEVEAVQSVTMDLPHATFVALSGPSGSGKSSMLYVLAGLLRPTRGTVSVDGNDLTSMTADQLARYRCANIGFIFQSFQLLPHLSAWENVALPLIPLGVAAPVRRARACKLLSSIGLGARVTHKPGELSAGEQQRVAMARAVINSPTLVLADEPTGNLDAANAALVAGEMERLVRELGATVVCATHDERLASRAQVVARMEHGRVVDQS
jgi:putative ABC transport system ATP-binding protein